LDEFILWCGILGRLDLAAEVCETRLTRNADDVETMIRLAQLRFQAGRFDDGVALLARAAELAPTHVAACSMLAVALAERGELDRARDLLVPVLRENPANIGLHRQMAELLQAMGRVDEARTHYDRVAELQSR